MPHRLITVTFSHYSEIARWALDVADIDYVEEPYMPLLSSAAVALATAGRGGSADRVSSRYSCPCMILHDGTRMHDSAAITRWASDQRRLDWYSNPEAEVLSRRFHDTLGPHARRLVYGTALDNPSLLTGMADANVPPLQARLFRGFFPLFKRTVRNRLHIDAKALERSLALCRAELDWVANRLADGRPYLLGDSFSAADLIFSALAAPGLVPTVEEGFGAVLPAPETMPAAARALVQEFRDHPAGAFALRMFAQHRHPARALATA
jgi:glutathione S-transferase